MRGPEWPAWRRHFKIQMQPISTFRSCCHHPSQLTRQSWTSQKKVSSSCLLCFDKSSLNIGIKKIIGLAGWKVQETAPRRPPTAPPRVGTGCKTKSFKLSPLSLNFLRPVTSCYKASQLRRLSSSAGNLFKIIFRASAERVQALLINLRYIYKRVFH